MSLVAILLISLAVGLVLLVGLGIGIYLFHLFSSKSTQEKQDDTDESEKGLLFTNIPSPQQDKPAFHFGFAQGPKFNVEKKVTKTIIKTRENVDVQNYVFNISGDFNADQISEMSRMDLKGPKSPKSPKNSLASNCLTQILQIRGTNDFIIPGSDITKVIITGLEFKLKNEVPQTPLASYPSSFKDNKEIFCKIQIQFDESTINPKAEKTNISFKLLISNSTIPVPKEITIKKILSQQTTTLTQKLS